MINRIVLTFLIASLNFHVSFSQSDTLDSYENVKRYEKKLKHSSSPYQFGFKKELPFLITGAALTTTGLILRETNTTPTFSSEDLDALNRNDVNPFDRGATYNYNTDAKTASDIILVSSIFIPTLFLINKNPRADFGPLIVMGLEVVLINYGLTAISKNVFNRSRPYVYNTELSDEERSDGQSRLSFFSGHTSATASFSFFVGKVINDYNPNMKTGWKIGLWTLTAAIPATTGYLRIEAGMHFRTDVIAGYAVGALTGWLVPHLHKKDRFNKNLSLFPTRVFGTSGIGMTYKF